MTAKSDFTHYGIIYRVRHEASGKVYIGQTTRSLMTRWQGHLVEKCCVKLKSAIKKHGPEAFSITELCKAYSKDELDQLEIKHIQDYDALNRDKGYNLMSGGSFGKHSDESKAKMSASVLKAYENPDFKAKLVAARTGAKRTDEFRAAASKRMTGTKISKETKDKLSEFVKLKWKSEDYRKKVSDGQLAARADVDYIKTVSDNTKRQWKDKDPEERQSFIDAQVAGRLAMWADPVRKAAILAKRRATMAAKKAAQI